MKLYKISQSQNTNYDSFDSAIVAANSEKEARNIHPASSWNNSKDYWQPENNGTWCNTPQKVLVEYLGKAKRGIKSSVLCASFNAG